MNPFFNPNLTFSIALLCSILSSLRPKSCPEKQDGRTRSASDPAPNPKDASEGGRLSLIG